MAKFYKNNNPEYLNTKEAASYLNVSLRFIRNAIDRGKLKCSKLSSRLIRIKKSDADKFMQDYSMGGISE